MDSLTHDTDNLKISTKKSLRGFAAMLLFRRTKIRCAAAVIAPKWRCRIPATILSRRRTVAAVDNVVDKPGKALGYAGDGPRNRLFRMRFRDACRVEDFHLAI